ncbi:Hypothetical predicted protein, partial [Olea europaea subsp. europaea]
LRATNARNNTTPLRGLSRLSPSLHATTEIVVVVCYQQERPHTLCATNVG